MGGADNAAEAKVVGEEADEESDAGSEDLEAESSGSEDDGDEEEEEVEGEGDADEEMDMGEDGEKPTNGETHAAVMKHAQQSDVMVH